MKELVVIRVLASWGLQYGVAAHMRCALEYSATKEELFAAIKAAAVPGGGVAYSMGVRALQELEQDGVFMPLSPSSPSKTLSEQNHQAVMMPLNHCWACWWRGAIQTYPCTSVAARQDFWTPVRSALSFVPQYISPQGWSNTVVRSRDAIMVFPALAPSYWHGPSGIKRICNDDPATHNAWYHSSVQLSYAAHSIKGDGSALFMVCLDAAVVKTNTAARTQWVDIPTT